MRQIITLIMALCVSAFADAQSRRAGLRYIEYQQQQVNKNYSDSLLAYKEMLQHRNLNNVNCDETMADGRFYRLFAPLTFYHAPAKKALRLQQRHQSIDGVDDEIDNTLMTVYLNRPDLVLNSENRLKRVGGVSSEIIAPIQQDVELVNKVEQKIGRAHV